MKVVGVGTVLSAGTVTRITNTGVEIVFSGKKVVYTFTDVEQMVGL